MATTTLKAIIDRFQAVLEAAPLSLTHTQQPFSFDQQPNTALNDRYWVQDAGLSESASTSNQCEVRLDDLIVWVARKLTEDGQAEIETMETDLVTAERYLVADGPANSYYTFTVGREISKADEANVVIGALRMRVDYDFTVSTS